MHLLKAYSTSLEKNTNTNTILNYKILVPTSSAASYHLVDGITDLRLQIQLRNTYSTTINNFFPCHNHFLAYLEFYYSNF